MSAHRCRRFFGHLWRRRIDLRVRLHAEPLARAAIVLGPEARPPLDGRGGPWPRSTSSMTHYARCSQLMTRADNSPTTYVVDVGAGMSGKKRSANGRRAASGVSSSEPHDVLVEPVSDAVHRARLRSRPPATGPRSPG